MEYHLQKGMIDTHFHGLIMDRKKIDCRAVLQKAFDTGLEYAIDIGTQMEDIEVRFELLAGFNNILFAAGNYPSEVEKDSIQNLILELEKNITAKNSLSKKNRRISAIGEIGLDWHWNYGTKRLQTELFEAQIELANKYKLPVLIHNREADKEIIEILKKTPPAAGGILHCFSSDYHAARSFLDLGLSISFAGNVTYKKNIELREVAAKIPLKSIFIETDSPYLSPQKVSGKTNHPGHIGFTYETIAECRKMPVDEFIISVKDNFLKLFNPE